MFFLPKSNLRPSLGSQGSLWGPLKSKNISVRAQFLRPHRSGHPVYIWVWIREWMAVTQGECWGDIVMVSELSCSPAPMPLRVITVHTRLQSPSPQDESHCSHPPPYHWLGKCHRLLFFEQCTCLKRNNSLQNWRICFETSCTMILLTRQGLEPF